MSRYRGGPATAVWRRAPGVRKRVARRERRVNGVSWASLRVLAPHWRRPRFRMVPMSRLPARAAPRRLPLRAVGVAVQPASWQRALALQPSLLAWLRLRQPRAVPSRPRRASTALPASAPPASRTDRTAALRPVCSARRSPAVQLRLSRSGPSMFDLLFKVCAASGRLRNARIPGTQPRHIAAAQPYHSDWSYI